MDHRVHEQMPACVQTKDLAVNHMREPSEGMPVCGMKRRERPCYSFQRQAADDHRVIPDVDVVVEADKLMTDHLAVNRENGKSECCCN